MLKTVRLAKKHNKFVGSHPGLPNLLGFGRRPMQVDPDDMFASVLYQVGALEAVLKSEGMKLAFVKPHGELYFYLQADNFIREAVVRAVATFGVPLYGLPTEALAETCGQHGVELIPEFFPDIDYDTEGQLVPVGRSASVNPLIIKRRVKQFASSGEVTTSSGTRVCLPGFGVRGQGPRGFTVCIHSDLPGAVENAAAAKEALAEVLSREDVLPISSKV
ncbi:hypothetical protein Neosp_003078 [[Neocosmospora] mangrovei]